MPLPGCRGAWCGGRTIMGITSMLDTGIGTARERLAGLADDACRRPATALGPGLARGVGPCPVSCSP
jgi:hypothetical protein